MQEFLNPKSMVTPGAAGAFMMFLVNGLHLHFPEISARFAALGISFLIGAAVVFYSQHVASSSLPVRGVYWVLNSLVVFVVGFGANNLGVEANRQADLLPSIIASAHAQPEPKKTAKAPAGKAELKAELEKARLENEKLRFELEELQKKSAAAKAPAKEKAFFQRW